MFQTYPESEVKLPGVLATLGEKSWRWIELVSHIPYFYLSVKVDAGEGFLFGREYIFCHLVDMLTLMTESGDEFKDIEIGLMSPGHMNGSDFYQLGRIKEIWERKSDHKRMFVMSDDTKIFDSTDDEVSILDHPMELLIKI